SPTSLLTSGRVAFLGRYRFAAGCGSRNPGLLLGACCGLSRWGAGAALAHPAFNDLLRCRVTRHRPWRDAVTDDRASTGVGAVADDERRDEGVVRAHAHVVAHRRVALCHAVVIDKDRRGADVRLLTDGRVAHI